MARTSQRLFKGGVTITVGLSTVFVLLVGAIMAAGVLYWARSAEALATEAAKQRFALATQTVVDKTERAIEPAELIVGLLSRDVRGQGARAECDWCSTLAQALVGQPISSAYVGWPNDDFVRVTRFAEPRMRARARAPASADWGVQTVRSVDGKRIGQWRFFFDDGRDAGGAWQDDTPSFFPSRRPWFERAQGQTGTVFTEPYVFAATEIPGITLAKVLASSGGGASGGTSGAAQAVAGVDLSLGNWSELLQAAARQSGIAGVTLAVINDDRRVLAYSDPRVLQDRLAAQAQGGANQSLEIARIADFSVAGDVALSKVLPESVTRFQGVLPEPMFGGLYALKRQFGAQSYALVMARQADLTAELDAVSQRSVWVSGLAALGLLPMVAWIGWLIARPMRAMAERAAGIAEVRDPGPAPRRSWVRELNALGQAIHGAQSSVAQFGKFAPRSVVERIVQGRHLSQLGGQRQQATILFTDVQGFSRQAEQMSPEELTARMTEYFSVLAGCLIEHGATIDKYIGDSVMAFWNAPEAQADHALLAARGALAAKAAVAALNARWQAQGKAPMPTRIGLHSGEVVIGNVGSADRMSYTALGAAANMASRLEGVNKAFGSDVLASADVVAQLGLHVVRRSLGAVVPTGTATPIEVFELLATAESADEAHHALCSGWADLITRWRSARTTAEHSAVAVDLAARTNDSVAQRLAQVAQARAAGLAAVSSDGAWRLADK